jgi:hypothetical protein
MSQAQVTATVTKKGFGYVVTDSNGNIVPKDSMPNLMKSQAFTAGAPLYLHSTGTWSLEPEVASEAAPEEVAETAPVAKKRGRPADPNKAAKEVKHRPVSVDIKPTDGLKAKVTQDGRLFRVMTLDGLDITSSVEWKTKMRARKFNKELVFENGIWDLLQDPKQKEVVEVPEGTIAIVKPEGRLLKAFTLDGKDVSSIVPQRLRFKSRSKGWANVQLLNGEWVIAGGALTPAPEVEQEEAEVTEPANIGKIDIAELLRDTEIDLDDVSDYDAEEDLASTYLS